jgi:crotonobetainyl-CoA:carnitine CoA-transferase CaiB-like acyl-CoA transferase
LPSLHRRVVQTGRVHDDARPGPLAGVRVLDLSSVIMGPFATQLLGDLGAEVICIEHPHGDTNRIMGTGPVPGMSALSLNLLRNKRNVCLDLKRPGAREAVLRIAATCDVVITNLRPGPLRRLGLEYEAIRAVRPDVVMCQAHGWPSDGPEAERPAYDDVIQAASGISHTFTLHSGTPALAPMLVVDKVAGLTIVYAVLAALFHRQRTGQGQFVEVPMIEALTSFNLVEHGAGAIPEPPLGPAGYGRIVAADRRPFESSDGWLAVLPYSQPNYADLFREGGRLDLVDDPRIATAAARNANAADLYSLVAPIIAMRTTAFWIEFCAAHDIPAGAVRSLDDVTAELPLDQHPTAGAYRRIMPAARFTATPVTVRRQAPLLGQHGVEVLREVGMSDDEIDALIAGNALQPADHRPSVQPG